jgi:hypothetical protein
MDPLWYDPCLERLIESWKLCHLMSLNHFNSPNKLSSTLWLHKILLLEVLVVQGVHNTGLGES